MLTRISQLVGTHKHALMALALCLIAVPAFAGTGGSELDALWTEVAAWLTGAPGKIFALGFIILGIWMARGGQFLWFFAGLMMAIIITLVPGIINSKFTAVM